MLKNVLPPAFLKLEKLLEGTKYICGDQLCQYDFSVAGYIVNTVYNENTKLKGVKECYEANAPEKIKTYVAAYKAEMQTYLDERDKKHPNIAS